MNRIFQEFYRVDGESADVSKGMGLGLHIVARTADVLGAALAVRSAEAAGLTLIAVARADGFEVFSAPQRVGK